MSRLCLGCGIPLQPSAFWKRCLGCAAEWRKQSRCEVCGISMADLKGRRFCSKFCGRVSRGEVPIGPKQRPEAHWCEVCGLDLSGRRKRGRWCSPRCNSIVRGNIFTGPRPWLVCALPECEVEFEAKRLGHRCCTEQHTRNLLNREYRAAGIRYAQNPETKRASDRRWSQFRRAVMRDSEAEMVDLDVIMERDGPDCALCGEWIDPWFQSPDPLSRSLDHVIPLSRGGKHRYDNCQAAHLGCNMKKGASLIIAS